MASALLLGSCSGQPPELAQLFWQLNVVQDTEDSSQHEELTLFVHAEDPDGVQDIDRLELLQNEQELLWSFSAGQWRRVEREGETWIGMNGIRGSSGRSLPRGEYRVKLSDKAGQSAETAFIISRDINGLQKGSLATGRFPAAEIGSRRLSVSAHGPELLISLYDGQDAFLKSELVELERSGAGTQGGESDGESGYLLEIENWAARWPGARRFRLQQYDAGRGYGLVSGPYDLPAEQ